MALVCLILADSWMTAGMWQCPTVPLLNVILVAVHSRGTSFNPSSASCTICLSDVGMPLPRLPPPFFLLSSTFHSFLFTSSLSLCNLTYSITVIHPLPPPLIYSTLAFLSMNRTLHMLPFPPIFSHSVAPLIALMPPQSILEMEGMNHLWLCSISSRRI